METPGAPAGAGCRRLGKGSTEGESPRALTGAGRGRPDAEWVTAAVAAAARCVVVACVIAAARRETQVVAAGEGVGADATAGRLSTGSSCMPARDASAGAAADVDRKDEETPRAPTGAGCERPDEELTFDESPSAPVDAGRERPAATAAYDRSDETAELQATGAAAAGGKEEDHFLARSWYIMAATKMRCTCSGASSTSIHARSARSFAVCCTCRRKCQH